MTERPSAPWTGAQLRAVAVCDVVGLAVVLLTALGAGAQDSFDRQIAWIDAAVVALVLVVVVNGTLFLLGRRAVGHRRHQLLPDLVQQPAPGPRPVARTRSADAAADAGWWVPGTARVHTEGCPMVAGKPAQRVPSDERDVRDLRACELCR